MCRLARARRLIASRASLDLLADAWAELAHLERHTRRALRALRRRGLTARDVATFPRNHRKDSRT
jgi:hypothetical protein